MRLFNGIFSSLFFVIFLVLAGPSCGWVWALGILGLGSLAYYVYIRWRTRAKKIQAHNKNSMVEDESDERS